jgi:N-acetyl-alpha-D-glucosaminyl L-malate synthase BshA
MRVGVVTHGGMGGSGTVAAELALGLAARGHEVHLVTPQRPFRLAADADGVNVHEVVAARHPMWTEAPWPLAVASRIAAVARDARLDVIHVHFAVPYAVAAELACRMLGDAAPPWIATLHGTDVEPLGTDAGYGPVTRFALASAARITVPSQHLRSAAARAGLGDVALVPNFVDADRFRPAPDREPPGTAVFVHASNFRPVKRALDVAAVFARVAQDLPARLLLVGDGTDRQATLDRLAESGVGDRVEAPGARADVEHWLGRAHVALVPSERESFGLAALEALASGVPVVGSRVGGLPEVVEHGVTGLLADAGDVAAMAAHARALVSDAARWRTMADAARRAAIARFTPAHAIDAYTAIYRAARRGTS